MIPSVQAETSVVVRGAAATDKFFIIRPYQCTRLATDYLIEIAEMRVVRIVPVHQNEHIQRFE